jgi:hypothetical protein
MKHDGKKKIDMWKIKTKHFIHIKQETYHHMSRERERERTGKEEKKLKTQTIFANQTLEII